MKDITAPHAAAADAPILPSGAHSDFRREMSYGGYLDLDALLSCQKPLTDEHDEPLFVMIHHVSEIWMKLILHELGTAMNLIRKDTLPPAFKMISRVSKIQSQLLQSWGVLATMTPADYLRFRDKLGYSSGFQSYQYREIEYRFGNKNAAMLRPHAHLEKLHAHLSAVLHAPSIYDETIALLARRGLPVAPELLKRDFSERHQAHDSVREAWLTVYRNTERYWDLYELAEKLVDMEDSFQQWRYAHLRTVTRIIGMRRGTGGTDGVPYLQKALNYCFFPELWDIRTML